MYMCPHCNSKEIKKFTIIYQEGTTIGASKHKEKHTFSTIYNTVQGYGTTVGKKSSQSQTNLAKRCSPPKRPYPTKYFHVFAIIGGFIIYAYLSELIPQDIQKLTIDQVKDFQIPKIHARAIVSLILLLLSIIFIYIARYFLYSKKLWKKYRIDKLNYPKSWICLSCGQNFLIT